MKDFLKSIQTPHFIWINFNCLDNFLDNASGRKKRHVNALTSEEVNDFFPRRTINYYFHDAFPRPNNLLTEFQFFRWNFHIQHHSRVPFRTTSASLFSFFFFSLPTFLSSYSKTKKPPPPPRLSGSEQLQVMKRRRAGTGTTGIVYFCPFIFLSIYVPTLDRKTTLASPFQCLLILVYLSASFINSNRSGASMICSRYFTSWII